MLTEIERRVTSSGGVWSALAVGPLVVTSVIAANLATAATPVSVRLRKAPGSTQIVPMDLLPGAEGQQGTRLRLVVLPLMAGDSLDVRSDAQVSWLALGAELISARQFNRVLSAAGDAWATIADQPGSVTGLLAANLGLGEAVLSARVLRAGNATSMVVASERIEEGASRRITPVCVLAAGESLQVRARGTVDCIATGVLAS